MRTLLLVAMLSCAASAAAQQPPRLVRFDVPAVGLQLAQTQTASTERMVFGGLALGAVGFFGGGYLGAIIADRSSDLELAALTGFAVGAVIGETVGLPLGVHIANRNRGDYVPALLTSAAVAAAGMALASRGEDNLEYLIPVPIIQLITSIAIERRTSR